MNDRKWLKEISQYRDKTCIKMGLLYLLLGGDKSYVCVMNKRDNMFQCTGGKRFKTVLRCI